MFYFIRHTLVSNLDPFTSAMNTLTAKNKVLWKLNNNKTEIKNQIFMVNTTSAESKLLIDSCASVTNTINS